VLEGTWGSIRSGRQLISMTPDRVLDWEPGKGSDGTHDAGSFSALHRSFSAIGGYDLKSQDDQVFALDYDASGRPDHVCLYRPASGTFWTLFKAAVRAGHRTSGM
jgi:hypothetical protein